MRWGSRGERSEQERKERAFFSRCTLSILSSLPSSLFFDPQPLHLSVESRRFYLPTVLLQLHLILNPFLPRRGLVFLSVKRERLCFLLCGGKKEEEEKSASFFSFFSFFCFAEDSREREKKKFVFFKVFFLVSFSLSLLSPASSAGKRRHHPRRHLAQRAQHKRLGEARRRDSLRLRELLQLLLAAPARGLRGGEQQRRRRGLRRRERRLRPSSSSSEAPRDHLRGREGRRRAPGRRRRRRRGRRGRRPARDRVDDGKGDGGAPFSFFPPSSSSSSAALFVF